MWTAEEFFKRLGDFLVGIGVLTAVLILLLVVF